MESRVRCALPRNTTRGRARPRGSSREIRGDSQSQIADPRWVRRVVVKPFAGFLAQHAGEHHPLKEGGRRVATFSVLVEHDLGDFIDRVEPDEIKEREGTNRVARAELHSFIDVLYRADL